MSRRRFEHREFIGFVPSMSCFSVITVITELCHQSFNSFPDWMRTETISTTSKAGSRLASKKQAKSINCKASY
jgi:hypothetical protein